MMMYSEPTLRERTVKKVEDWINNHVPIHTRAEYQELLASHEDVVIALWRKSVAYDELQVAYRNLQDERVKALTHAVTPVRATIEAWTLPTSMERLIEARITPSEFNMRIAVADRHLYDRDIYPETHRAFKRMIEEEYLPRLIKEVEEGLVRLAQA